MSYTIKFSGLNDLRRHWWAPWTWRRKVMSTRVIASWVEEDTRIGRPFRAARGRGLAASCSCEPDAR